MINIIFKINDKIYGPYDHLTPPIFSKDGSKYYWEFTKDHEYYYEEYYIQINDKTYGPYDKIYNPTFSTDDSKFGFGFVKDNKGYIQINDKTYGPYDYATFTFTKDNKAYIAYISGNELIIEEVE